MDISNEILPLIGQPENTQLEYKAVLPPSRSIGQIISAFANTEGGFIVMGVAETSKGFVPTGLSDDFQANTITHKAIDLLTPTPNITYQHLTYDGKRLYVIKVEKSSSPVSIEGKFYTRTGASTVLKNPVKKDFKKEGYSRIEKIFKELETIRKTSTSAKSKFIDHYLSVLNILDDLGPILYPVSPANPTTVQEGKILMRILFSSCADNFETYLSELLYEIYLANPSTLKSAQTVTLKEVLDCADMQEFVIYYSKKRLSKLQRGSVKGFISDNKQLNDLQVLDATEQDNIENILQVRHLYAHRNGIVDEKFLQHYSGTLKINDEHQFSVDELLNNFSYLADSVDKLDKAAIKKYLLATLD